jgi:hypothetical protein
MLIWAAYLQLELGNQEAGERMKIKLRLSVRLEEDVLFPHGAGPLIS